jgi:hypothetical protein
MTGEASDRGRFSEGQERTPEDDAEKEREGSFADGQTDRQPASEDPDGGGYAVGQATSDESDEPADDLEGDFGRGQRHEDGG